MMAKSYLEGGDKAQEREYRQVMIDAKKKEMNPDFLYIKSYIQKIWSIDDANQVQLLLEKFGSDAYGGALMSTKDFNKQLKAFEGEQLEEKTILDIATNAVNQIEASSMKEGARFLMGTIKLETKHCKLINRQRCSRVELVG